MPESIEYAPQRAEMVEKQLRRRGIEDSYVLGAMLKLPRHEFVPEEFRARAYEDVPLPIGLRLSGGRSFPSGQGGLHH